MVQPREVAELVDEGGVKLSIGQLRILLSVSPIQEASVESRLGREDAPADIEPARAGKADDVGVTHQVVKQAAISIIDNRTLIPS